MRIIIVIIIIIFKYPWVEGLKAKKKLKSKAGVTVSLERCQSQSVVQ